jgi:predicted nuclease of restriction endonuclease-like (RecB) superfamily
VKALIVDIRELIRSARKAVAQSVDLIQVLTNFEIGRRIVEHEQRGKERAEYGKALLKTLSTELTEEFGKGFSERNLRSMRKFFLTYRERFPAIRQMPLANLPTDTIPSASSGSPGDKVLPQIRQMPSAEFTSPFKLSWSQYVFLISISNPNERGFYEVEAASNDWTLPELKRQFDSGLYERLALSRDQAGIRRLAAEGQIVARPEDLLKEPYVLEFLGLDEKAKYSESDLESAIIDKLEQFLLELGKGFLFEARQKRFTFDEEHFFVDLVFYNRLLRCYVLIDLKIGKLNHGDLGQMQMYVNYFDRYVKLDEEAPTVGIVLCKKKHDALVEITLPKEANIHAREYQLYLPDKELLRRKLEEWGKGVLDDEDIDHE